MPPKDGEAVAVLALANAYKKLGHEVDLLAFNTSKHYVQDAQLDGVSGPYGIIKTVYLDTSINYYKAFLNLFSKDSFNIQRFKSPKFYKVLSELIQNNKYDLVQFESLYMAPYISTVRANSNATVVMRSHNIEFRIWKDMAKQNPNLLLSWYYALCARRLETFELAQLNSYDHLWAISKSDEEYYKDKITNESMSVIPVGFDSTAYSFKPPEPNKDLTIGYLGSLDWKPNVEGLLWFFKEAWPAINERYACQFMLAGRNPVEEIRQLSAKGLLMKGEVDDARAFLETLDIVVVPLFSGSGIRVKILESMAMGKIVISTNKGFEGIDIKHGTHAFIFNTVEELHDVMEEVMNHKELQVIARNAREFIKQEFDYLTLAEKALKMINNE